MCIFFLLLSLELECVQSSGFCSSFLGLLGSMIVVRIRNVPSECLIRDQQCSTSLIFLIFFSFYFSSFFVDNIDIKF